MTIPQELSPSARSSRGGEAASLSLIKLQRADRAAGAITKTTDLTHRLHRPPINAVQTVVTREFLPVAPASNPLRSETATSADPPAAGTALDIPAPDDRVPVVHRTPPIPQPLEKKASADTAPAPVLDDDFQSGEALLGYWDELRGARDLPLFTSLDRTRIAVSWPNSLMVSYSGGNIAMPQITRLSRHTGEVEYTSMVTEWILACSRQAARVGKPMENERDFPLERRSKNYRMLLLPFSSAGGATDYVLCHLRYVE